jgi:hypothetical protein
MDRENLPVGFALVNSHLSAQWAATFIWAFAKEQYPFSAAEIVSKSI